MCSFSYPGEHALVSESLLPLQACRVALSNPISGGRSTSYVKNNFYVRRTTKKKRRKRPQWNVAVLRETGERGLLNLHFGLPKLRNPPEWHSPDLLLLDAVGHMIRICQM